MCVGVCVCVCVCVCGKRGRVAGEGATNLSNAATRQHVGRDTADAADANHNHTALADVLIALHNAHALQVGGGPMVIDR